MRNASSRFADGIQLAKDVEALGNVPCDFLPSTRRLDVDCPPTPKEYPPYRLTFLGRWHRNKGIDILMKSLLLLNDDDWKAIDSVEICGGGPLEKEVKQYCGILQDLGRPVRTSGYLNRKEATEVLLGTDYLLLPSRKESIPVIFSDALQTGCPVIASPVGDLPRLYKNNKFGIMAQDVTSLGFSRAIKESLLTSPVNFINELSTLRTQFDLTTSTDTLLRSIK